MKKMMIGMMLIAALGLFAGCSNGASGSDDGGSGNNGGESGTGYNTRVFKEGWWQYESKKGTEPEFLQNGENPRKIGKMWIKYNADKKCTKCLIRIRDSVDPDLTDITRTLHSAQLWYEWDVMKQHAQSTNADYFRHVDAVTRNSFTHFREGWWECDFQDGSKKWLKYNDRQICVQCITKADLDAETIDETATLNSAQTWYEWDSMKKNVRDADWFIPVEQSKVPKVNPSITFVEGWWKCDFGEGNTRWIQYNAERNCTKCIIQLKSGDNIRELTSAQKPESLWYKWIIVKQFTGFEHFTPIADSEVPNI